MTLYRILRLPRVTFESGLSRSTIYLRIEQGLWPRPVSLGARAVGWPADEVAAMNAARIAGHSDNLIRALVLQLMAKRKTALDSKLNAGEPFRTWILRSTLSTRQRAPVMESVVTASELALTRKGRRTATAWLARCPAHEDTHESLSIGEGAEGRVLLKCFAGCPVETILAAMNLTMADLFPAGGRGSDSSEIRLVHSNTLRPGLTLADYASDKQLPVDYLRELGLAEIHYNGVRAIRSRIGTRSITRRRCKSESR